TVPLSCAAATRPSTLWPMPRPTRSTMKPDPMKKSRLRVMVAAPADVRLKPDATVDSESRTLPFQELLDALALVGLARVDVALRAEAEGVEAVKAAGEAPAVAEAGHHGERVALQHPDFLVLPVGDIELPLLRIGRERHVPDRALAPRVLGDDHLLHE